MANYLRILVLLGLTLSVRALTKASHLSNKREVSDICADSSITQISCADVGTDGLLAHPDDCRLFYQCTYGVPFCQRCPDGLHFNPALHVCDAPEQAGCVAPGAGQAAPVEDQFNKDDSKNEIPPRCAVNSVTPVSCADAASPDALLPHPDDCNLFYYCVGAAAAPVCRQCSAGLHFNPALHVCDAPDHAGCDAPTGDPTLKLLIV
ncbi:peritrophin-1-like [Ostrinia furnacalis]|uniref:peritrophin-1-like n=1 Tax=Ostrinia furnacalis TaxID=93504 RepID=UPI0010390D96|nr:peritrophin-1-like [Ostrinia furnacalis]